jgi:hypothetical protein
MSARDKADVRIPQSYAATFGSDSAAEPLDAPARTEVLFFGAEGGEWLLEPVGGLRNGKEINVNPADPPGAQFVVT